MAVQKSKKSRSKRDSRRAHDSLSSPQLCIDKESGEKHIRHHLSASGFYRAQKVSIGKVDKDSEE